jgi:hypothetical protein
VEIGLLGPVEIRDSGGELRPVVGARLRTLLVLLALDAGRDVSADRLIDGLWGEVPPAAAPGLDVVATRSYGYAVPWTGCLSPSSWPRLACVPCRRRFWPTGSGC